MLLRLTALALILSSASGCSQDGQSDERANSPFPPLIPMVTANELQPVKSPDVLGHSITWVAHDAPGNWGDLKEIGTAVQTAISTSASRLAAIDYGALSLPAFITQTRALTPKPSDLTGQGVYEEARGKDDNGQEWLLYGWKGPAFPQHPDRPQVFRWVQVYALYNVQDKTVDRLITTIGGEAHE